MSMRNEGSAEIVLADAIVEENSRAGRKGPSLSKDARAQVDTMYVHNARVEMSEGQNRGYIGSAGIPL